MSMGNINMKLMQGIDETENQLQKEKQTPKTEEAVRKETENRDTKETDRKPQKAVKQLRTKKNTGMRKNSEKETDKMLKKQVFSFRALIKDISIWRAYAVASGKSMEDICNAAMNEYIKKHKLADIEQAIFEALKTRDGIGNG